MANWKYILDLKDIWKKAKDREISACELSKEVVKKLEVFPTLTNDMELQDIQTEFQNLTSDPTATFDEFDQVLSDLYDWADQEIEPFGQWPSNKLCWIKTL